MAKKFPSYREYRDSSVEWLGRIPTEWDLWKLAHAFSEIGSGTTPPSDSSEWYGEGVPWITTGELRERKILGTTKNVTVSALKKFPTLRVYPKGSIVIAMYGATIGRLGILGVEAATNQACCVFPDSKFIFNTYLYYWFQAFRDDIVNLASGGGQPNISQAVVSALRISRPKKAEQTQIAKFLDYETGKMDALIEKQQQLIRLLKEKRQAVISHAVTKGLNPDAPLRDSGIPWLGEVPAHWEVTRAKHLFDFVTSGSRGWAEFYSDEGSLFFRIANLTRDTIEPKLLSIQNVTPPHGSEGERSRIKENDLLISITADLGSVCVGDDSIAGGYVSQHVALCRPNRQVKSSRWLAYLILSDVVKEQLIGSGYGGTKIQLSLEDIREIVLAVPDSSEQGEITEYIDVRMTRFSILMEASEQTIALLQERRTALISAAVTGKIDVRNWQPPAPQTQTEQA